MLIIANGRAQAPVVIPAGASETNRFAAEELIKYLKKMSGVELTLYEDSYPLESAPERFEICVGPVDRAGRPGMDGLKNDGYRLTLAGNGFFIQGENDRGILYLSLIHI